MTTETARVHRFVLLHDDGTETDLTDQLSSPIKIEPPARFAGALDRALAAAAIQYRAGNAALWRTAFAAAVVVGSYEVQLTRTLASSISRSVDTVERLARAARCYLDLAALIRAHPSAEVRGQLMPALRYARQRLSYSHFATMGQLWRAYDLTPNEVFAALHTAALEGTSVRELSMNVQNQARAELGANFTTPTAALEWPARAMGGADALKRLRAQPNQTVVLLPAKIKPGDQLTITLKP